MKDVPLGTTKQEIREYFEGSGDYLIDEQSSFNVKEINYVYDLSERLHKLE